MTSQTVTGMFLTAACYPNLNLKLLQQLFMRFYNLLFIRLHEIFVLVEMYLRKRKNNACKIHLPHTFDTF